MDKKLVVTCNIKVMHKKLLLQNYGPLFTHTHTVIFVFSDW